MSLEGGRSYEFEQDDPAMAIDAYSFYLAQIESRELRLRLQFCVARCAHKAGISELAQLLWEQLFRDGGGVMTADRLPVDALAGLELVAVHPGQPAEKESLKGAVTETAVRSMTMMRTAFLAHAARVLAPSPVLDEIVARRLELERAIAAQPSILRAPSARLDSDGLLLSWRLPDSDRLGVTRVPVRLPPLVGRAGYSASLRVAESEAVESLDDDEAEHSVAIRLHGDGPAVALLTVRDDLRAAEIAELKRRRSVYRTLIGLLVASTLAGGGALVFYLGRERRLARLRTQLLANVSHELKTPTTAIRMFAEMLADDELDKETSGRFTKLMHGESLRLSRIIENVLEFSQLERGERPLALEMLDVEELVRRVVEGFRPRAESDGVDLQLRSNIGESRQIESNSSAIERVTMNLIDNAHKYRREDGGAFIRVELDADAAGVRIAVEDNGRGIVTGDQERVFEEFYRADYEDYGVKGTGLGLAIARRLAHGVGGRLTLSSIPGKGSRFVLQLPREASPALDGQTAELGDAHGP